MCPLLAQSGRGDHSQRCPLLGVKRTSGGGRFSFTCASLAVRRHMGRLVALGLFERAEDQTFVPAKELREVGIERALRLLRQGTAGLL